VSRNGGGGTFDGILFLIAVFLIVLALGELFIKGVIGP
jgi:hypothetical protein